MILNAASPDLSPTPTNTYSPTVLLVEPGLCSQQVHRRQDLAVTEQPRTVWLQTPLYTCMTFRDLSTSNYKQCLETRWASIFKWVSVHTNCGCVAWPKGKLCKTFNFLILFFGVFCLFFSMCFIMLYSAVALGKLTKSTVALFYYEFCFPDMLQLLKLFLW